MLLPIYSYGLVYYYVFSLNIIFFLNKILGFTSSGSVFSALLSTSVSSVFFCSYAFILLITEAEAFYIKPWNSSLDLLRRNLINGSAVVI